MVSIGYRDEITRFILDSPEEDNEDLAVFMAGIRAQKEAFEREKAGEAAETGQAVIRRGESER
jgi:hypothetical protein